jgi:hypothetical protein
MWQGFFWQSCGFEILVKISNLWPILFEFTLKNENFQFNFFSIFVGGKVAKFCQHKKPCHIKVECMGGRVFLGVKIRDLI